MNNIVKILIALLFVSVIFSCTEDDIDEVIVPDFNFPQAVVFEQNLSAYNIFDGVMSDLVPSDDFKLLELSSILFTDYAYKQRLVKVPNGTQMTRLNDNSIDFPDGTILTKTFFYHNDERDISLGKKIMETRLLIKENNIWNAATYVWNENQTDATIELNGTDTPISWINDDGISRSTTYQVPTSNQCMACHQSNSAMKPLGTKLRNLNINVERNGNTLNQLTHLQNIGILNNFSTNQIGQIVDYNDLNASLSERGRAYMEMNCAHCHNPTGWEEPAGEGFDFRYETQLNQTGILGEQGDIIEVITNGEMPFLGTTIRDQEGIDLLIEYIESL